jgi:hypothetical protein
MDKDPYSIKINPFFEEVNTQDYPRNFHKD